VAEAAGVCSEWCVWLAGQGDKSAVDMAKIVQERDQLKALDKQRRKLLHDQRAAFEVSSSSASSLAPPPLLFRARGGKPCHDVCVIRCTGATARIGGALVGGGTRQDDRDEEASRC